MNREEYISHILDIVEKNGSDIEPGQLQYWATLRDIVEENDVVREQDRRFVMLGRTFAKWYTDGEMTIKDHGPWWDHIARIVSGDYPLDNLPDHVRDLARELYYD